MVLGVLVAWLKPPLLFAHLWITTSCIRLLVNCKVRLCLLTAGFYAKNYVRNDDRDEVSSQAAIEWIQAAVQTNNGECSTSIAQYFVNIHFDRLAKLGLKSDADKVDEYARIILNRHPNDVKSVYKLLTVLHVRYLRTFSLIYVEQALHLAESAAVALGDDHPELPLILGACGVALLDYSEAKNCTESLDMAIEIFRAAEAMIQGNLLRTHAWSLVRVNRAEALRRQFEASGDRSTLDAALRIFDDIGDQARFQIPEVLEYGMIRLRILHTLWRLEPNMDSLQSLRKEYAGFQQAYLTKNHRSPTMPELMQASGKALNETWSMSGGRSEYGFSIIQSGLDFARKLLHAWDQLDDASAPGLAPYLFEMAIAYDQKYEAYFTPIALEHACNTLMLCCTLTDRRSTHMGVRSAAMVRTINKMSGIVSERLEEKIRELRRVTLTSILLAPLTMKLGAKAALAKQFALLAIDLFERSQDVSYLDRAIGHNRKAVDLALTDTSQLVDCLHDLARAYLRRGKVRAAKAKKEGTRAQEGKGVPEERAAGVEALNLAAQDLEATVNTLERINDLGRQIGFTNMDGFETLGNARREQFNLTGNIDHANEAIDAWKIVYKSPNVGPVARWVAATSMSALQREIIPLIDGDLNNVADSLSDAVEATLALITDSDTREEQIWKIRIFSQLSSHAASVGLLAGKPPEAMLKLLERGRTLMWNRSLNRKVDISTLAEKHEVLAQRFVKAQQLFRTREAKLKRPRGELTFQETVELDPFHINNEYQKVIHEIQQQPGFEDFMQPSGQSEDLREYASEGPVVTSVQGQTCHAIIITKTRITTVHLPAFNKDECWLRFEEYESCLKFRADETEKATDMMARILTWLWAAAAEPVLKYIYEELGLNTVSPPKELPRIWWVTSGWINTFPIHAAGDHGRASTSGQPCSVMDMAVSSYTPTLQVLDYTRRTMNRMTTNPPESPSAVLVGMKFTPDKSPDLINAPIEIAAISKIIAEASYSVKTLGNPSTIFGKAATIKDTVFALRKSTIAVFACHGEASEDPIKSRLYLQDWRKRPFDVGLLMRMDFDNLQLVELSACEMAVNRDMLLQEEGLHMSGAFQMAGVPNTIATWWPVWDSYATKVSVGFHRGLLSDLPGSGKSLDVRSSAKSLWAVLKDMRDEGLSPFVWGAYAHFGV